MSFQQGLSGLNVAAKNLDAIGNNVANSTTIGYKAARAEFADVYANSLAGGGGMQIGIGAQVAAVKQQFTQGNITTTANPLDMAINGGGFFRLSSNGSVSYTRNGQFSLDKDGYIIANDGARLTGYPADSLGNVVVSNPTEIKLSLGNTDPSVTKNGSVAMNLDSRETVPSTTFALTDPTSYNSTTALTVYDVQGNAHNVSLYFRKTADNAWSVYGATGGAQIGSGPLGALNFNANGSLASGSPQTVTLTGMTGVQGPLSFPLAFTGTTQYGVTFAINQLSQDGYTTGALSGFTVDNDGTILGRYTNGQSRAQGQLVLANFTNPQGLISLGGNQWGESAASGQPLPGTPGASSLGVVQSGALEEANVDLTAELVNMITAQRVYQANAQTIKAQDQVLQTIVNLR